MRMDSLLVSRLLALILVCGLGDTTVAAGPDGAAVFHAHCARCHGESGQTDTSNARPLKVRPLADDAELARMELDAIVEAIRSNPKHRGVGALTDIDPAELRAAAAFVRTLAAGAE